MKAKLYYDDKCPVCISYINLLRRKLNESEIDLLPFKGTAVDFQYVSVSGKVLSGNKAIEELANDFPAVTSYFWILPERYKVKALQAAYKVGTAVRNAITPKSKKKGCGCGKKKRTS